MYLFNLIEKLTIFARLRFVRWQKDFRMSFDVVMIYTKQSTPLTAANSEILIISEFQRIHYVGTSLCLILVGSVLCF